MNKKIIKKRIFILILVCVLSVLLSCATQKEGHRVRATGDADYQRLGLSKTKIAIWEDGMRTSGDKGNYEWWYFDTKMKDGSTLVIVFYTKNVLDINKPITPFVSVNMADPDGKPIIGKNTVKGDLRNYAIHLDFDDIQADLKLRGTIPSWRPETGHAFFISESGESYFAWFPAVPQGEVQGTLRIGGNNQVVEGSGYHDHNWGNALMTEQMHDWYWGRAAVGPYTVISSWITTTQKFGGQSGGTFVLWRDGKLLAEEGEYATCQLDDVYVDPGTKKLVANRLTYDYNDGTKHYRVIYEREKDIENVALINKLSGLKYLVATIIGFDGAYLRFSGTVTIEELERNTVTRSTTEGSAVWELMYLGHVPEPE
jgi:hypothetical protein